MSFLNEYMVGRTRNAEHLFKCLVGWSEQRCLGAIAEGGKYRMANIRTEQLNGEWFNLSDQWVCQVPLHAAYACGRVERKPTNWIWFNVTRIAVHYTAEKYCKSLAHGIQSFVCQNNAEYQPVTIVARFQNVGERALCDTSGALPPASLCDSRANIAEKYFLARFSIEYQSFHLSACISDSFTFWNATRSRCSVFFYALKKTSTTDVYLCALLFPRTKCNTATDNEPQINPQFNSLIFHINKKAKFDSNYFIYVWVIWIKVVNDTSFIMFIAHGNRVRYIILNN